MHINLVIVNTSIGSAATCSGVMRSFTIISLQLYGHICFKKLAKL